jgi:hypothetical protein
MDEIKLLLMKEIKDEINKLSSLSDGSEEKNRVIDHIDTLYRALIEAVKVENERKDKKFDCLFRFTAEVTIALLHLGSYDIWHRRGLRFEETGSYTSSHNRNLLSNMIPKIRRR